MLSRILNKKGTPAILLLLVVLWILIFSNWYEIWDYGSVEHEKAWHTTEYLWACLSTFLLCIVFHLMEWKRLGYILIGVGIWVLVDLFCSFNSLFCVFDINIDNTTLKFGVLITYIIVFCYHLKKQKEKTTIK